MSHGKETPRQKMIGMMYLVLTALLALNVSKDILNAFTVVNDNVLLTNENNEKIRQGAYANFERDYSLNKGDVGPFWDKAKKASELSTEMVKYIETIRDELIAKTEKIPIEQARKTSVNELKKKDNYTDPTAYLIGSAEDGSQGKARELKLKIIEYKKNLLGLIDKKYQNQIKLGLDTEGEFVNATGEKENWELHYFYDIPLAADIPILNKFISEVNNAEMEVVNGLLKEASADDFKYDHIEAKVLPKTNFLFAGDEYEAEVIVAAYQKNQIPKAYLMRGVDSLPLSKKELATPITSPDGRITLKFPTTAVGPQKYAGLIGVRNNSGEETIYHFKSEYLVAKPTITVSPVNMNVLYVGVNNPLSISVSGVPDEDVVPTISSGSLKPNREKGGWIAVVPDCKEAKIDVSVKVKGTMKRMGTQVFRVKRIPDPQPYIANKKDGFTTRNNLIQAGKITAKMPEDFEFDYSFKIISFHMNMQRGFENYHFKSDSDQLTDEMKKQIKNTNRGQTIVFEEIVARGPDGKNRTLSPLLITIN